MSEWLYGRQPVREVTSAGRRHVSCVVLADGLKKSDELDQLLAVCSQQNISVSKRSRAEIDKLTGGANHQGVVAEVSGFPYDDWKQIAQAAGAESVVLFLDHIQDPQNLGAILRSADAAGVDGVVIPKDRATAITPAVVRASAGGTEHMRVAKITNLVQVMKGFKDDGFWLHGLEADPDAKLYSESDFSGKVGIVVGSEGKGMGRLVKETCDFLVSIPLKGNVSSLNASVATGIVLFEVLRKKQLGEKK